MKGSDSNLGFAKAFNTTPTWNFTFFAPSNEAFNNTGAYFETYANTRYVVFAL